MRDEQEPTIREDRLGSSQSEIQEHPAFGTIVMTTPQGGKNTMFGSDVVHNGCVRIVIHEASLRRDLSHDWIHSQRQILELEMSHAQFARFITSNGNGGGTPVTLRWIRDVGELPGIKKIESKYDTHRKEIVDAAHERLQHIQQAIESLGRAIDGSISKKELRIIHENLKRHAEQLPGSMNFVVESAERALEKATTDAKIEVESYIDATARKLGLKSIQELAQLEDKSDH